ncbi:hypothetical protein JMJ77_0002764 [Colletotrichum scovillei]|uniref:Uncharacterized protein n=1 Tax=Colletotrichum scovillei TaxID=1209932 RepID=A0A9P7R8M6_9PEZI|nr:hypothetical protein JMJ77_0002764 [Colletotrichum scovillei]KAG7071188.1 hypothetical protein JMJ76_0002425 [Colletotrichum scovillei]KAG7079447.1 hypothetical protein JMJ78_0003100 [Colletotrichum scovillei]
MSTSSSPLALDPSAPVPANTTADTDTDREPSPLFLKLLKIYIMVSNLWMAIRAFLSNRGIWKPKPVVERHPNYEKLMDLAQRHEYLQCHKKRKIATENHHGDYFQQRVFTPEDDRKMWKTLLLPTIESKEEKEREEREEESKYLVDLIVQMPVLDRPCIVDEQAKADVQVEADEQVEADRWPQDNEQAEEHEQGKEDEQAKPDEIDSHDWTVEGVLATVDYEALGLQ